MQKREQTEVQVRGLSAGVFVLHRQRRGFAAAGPARAPPADASSHQRTQCSGEEEGSGLASWRRCSRLRWRWTGSSTALGRQRCSPAWPHPGERVGPMDTATVAGTVSACVPIVGMIVVVVAVEVPEKILCCESGSHPQHRCWTYSLTCL